MRVERRMAGIAAVGLFGAGAVAQTLLTGQLPFALELLVVAGLIWAAKAAITRTRSIERMSDDELGEEALPWEDDDGEGDPVEDDPIEDAAADRPADAGNTAPRLGPEMTYDETLSWLLSRVGQPLGVIMHACPEPGGPTALAPVMRAKGRLHYAMPDALAEQATGERLEFRVGPAARFSIGEVELLRAERTEEAGGGAILYFAGAELMLGELSEAAIAEVEEPLDVEDSP